MDVIFLTNYHNVCVCACVHVCVWAVFWGMSPELCSGLAIHRPPLQNGQNHTAMRHGRGRIPGMLKYRACHSPLPLTENTNACLPSSLLSRPGQRRREQQLRGEKGRKIEGDELQVAVGERLVDRWQWTLLKEGLQAASHKCSFRFIFQL